jgi:predicted nucleic acid-binding protein
LGYAHFERDCAASLWMLTGQPGKTFLTSVELARHHVATPGVRTLDSLHVAAALELKADVFWTFGERQKKLAEVKGLAAA